MAGKISKFFPWCIENPQRRNVADRRKRKYRGSSNVIHSSSFNNDLGSRTSTVQASNSRTSHSSSSNIEDRRRRLARRSTGFAHICTLPKEVTQAFENAGLKSVDFIVGIDFTQSNMLTGTKSFNKKSLHHIERGNENPYEQAISLIGRTLAAFGGDNIPCFGFGDASTRDQDVFSFYPDDCDGFEEVLSRYWEIAPQLRLYGPTSFAPIIEMAMTIVEKSGGQYHVLVIISDGQVTRGDDTLNAIVEASKFPLSIILVGVGDGPWVKMEQFEDYIPTRTFDNFRFVNFTKMSKVLVLKQTEFAKSALMEIPSQYEVLVKFNMLGYASKRQTTPKGPSSSTHTWCITSTSLKPSVPTAPPFPDEESTSMISSAPPDPNSAHDDQECIVCLSNRKDMIFDCGHQTCCECGRELETCPICRSPINTRIKFYH